MSTDTSSGGTSIYSITQRPGPGQQRQRLLLEVTNEQGGSSGTTGRGRRSRREIDAGHVMIWSALWEIHSLTGCGYRTEDKFVYVHNTWWTPAEWWTHSGDDCVARGRGHARRGRRAEHPHHLPARRHVLQLDRRAGEVLYVGDTCRVTWDNSGHPGTSVDIDLSVDGGRNWSTARGRRRRLGRLALVDQRRAQRRRLPAPAPEPVRRDDTWFRGDGRFGCFRMLKEPMPPPQLAPPNGLPMMNPPIVLGGRLAVQVRLDRLQAGPRHRHHLATARDAHRPASLPDSLFQRNKTYKWQVRGHNRYGWGAWSTVVVVPGAVRQRGRGGQVVRTTSVLGRRRSAGWMRAGDELRRARVRARARSWSCSTRWATWCAVWTSRGPAVLRGTCATTRARKSRPGSTSSQLGAGKTG